MADLERICVYCGSSPGKDGVYAAAARVLGRLLAERGIDLVYGGASRGIMGVIADAVLAGGGKVSGVIPLFMAEREIAHPALTELHVVDSMHERKALMADLADGFIAMPGGFGTLEEIVEIVTWGQLGFHDKPCGLLNTAGFFDSLLAFLDRASDAGFLRAPHRDMLLEAGTPEGLLHRLGQYEPPAVGKWQAKPA